MLSITAPALSARHVMRRAPLLKQELEVVTLVVEGFKDEEIGSRLGLGVPAVRRIISSASGKLGASDRLELVIHALLYGVVTPR